MGLRKKKSENKDGVSTILHFFLLLHKVFFLSIEKTLRLFWCLESPDTGIQRKKNGVYWPKQSCLNEWCGCVISVCQSATFSERRLLAPEGALSVTNTTTLSFTGDLWSQSLFQSVPATHHLLWSSHPKSGETAGLTPAPQVVKKKTSSKDCSF